MRFEQLERKDLLSSIVKVELNGNVLNIKGTSQNDTVLVQRTYDGLTNSIPPSFFNLRIQVTTITNNIIDVYNFPINTIEKIFAKLGGGDDRFIDTTNIISTALGGKGKDFLYGDIVIGSCDDTLIGQIVINNCKN